MDNKERKFESPNSNKKRDRSIIAKIGHINRELNTNNRLSDKSIERLKKIFLAQKQNGGFSGPDNYFDMIYESIERFRNFDHLNEEQKFWVYELMEFAQYELLEIDSDSF